MQLLQRCCILQRCRHCCVIITVTQQSPQPVLSPSYPCVPTAPSAQPPQPPRPPQQILGVFSQLLATMMDVLPIQRKGWLSDAETVNRFTRRPQTVMDALVLAQSDLILGVTTALTGALILGG